MMFGELLAMKPNQNEFEPTTKIMATKNELEIEGSLVTISLPQVKFLSLNKVRARI